MWPYSIHKKVLPTGWTKSRKTTSAIVSQYSSLTPQKWMIHNDRKIHSALIKLRTKHNGLKHNTSRHFHTIDEEDNEADPWCRFGCPKREDEDHLLLDCPQFESHRNKLKSHLADLKVSFSSKILLGLEKNIPEEKQLRIRGALVTFLAKTNIFSFL